ncbi:hypothetical protein [Ottowia testudinis]|uniref:Uncharacterized protein n=1 Tax=Ottowia testudinis TaxID=2816950 RepID=A0A975CF10_9BURK|nr:hypothetical protein [Ottowia testudinis]QTD44571.1 hypothetical protein J1M35_15945 [Ottowia testudinis]
MSRADHPTVDAGQPAPAIPLASLIAGAKHSAVDLTRDLRDLARQAACDWSKEHVQLFRSKSHEDFGVKVAQVYLAALRELNAAFEQRQEVAA